MDAKSIFALAVLAVIILAIIFNNNVKAKFMGFVLNTKNDSRSNKAKIKGNHNKITQSGVKSTSVNNTIDIEGDHNQSEQS